jgi:hypothetical protein
MYVAIRNDSMTLTILQVATAVSEMSSDAAAKLWDDNINRRLFDLMHSQNSVDKLGGLSAIGMQIKLCIKCAWPNVLQTTFSMSTRKTP